MKSIVVRWLRQYDIRFDIYVDMFSWSDGEKQIDRCYYMGQPHDLDIDEKSYKLDEGRGKFEFLKQTEYRKIGLTKFFDYLEDTEGENLRNGLMLDVRLDLGSTPEGGYLERLTKDIY